MATARVLVVDDEPAILKLVSRALTGCGYEVHGTTDPIDALEAVREPPGFDLVVSDVIMPGICGPELVKRIAAVKPTIGVVLMSGNVGCEKLPPETPFIGKPFVVTDLCSLVAKTLIKSLIVRSEAEQLCLTLIGTELELCLTLADLAETNYRSGNVENAARSIAKADKGYSDMLRFLSKAKGTPAAVVLHAKCKRVCERLDGLRH